MPNTIMTRLREETSEQHKYAESRPLELAMVRGTVSRVAFVEYLAQRLIVHRTLDAQVLALAKSDARLGDFPFEPLLQVRNLEQDLTFFEASTPSPLNATTQFLDTLAAQAKETPLAWLGSYYVFEGSKNGASFIARSIRKALSLETDGTLYLDPHGKEQRPLWMDFKARMDAIDFTPTEEDAMVSAAKLTFDGVSAIDDAVAAQVLLATA